MTNCQLVFCLTFYQVFILSGEDFVDVLKSQTESVQRTDPLMILFHAVDAHAEKDMLTRSNLLLEKFNQTVVFHYSPFGLGLLALDLAMRSFDSRSAVSLRS